LGIPNREDWWIPKTGVLQLAKSSPSLFAQGQGGGAAAEAGELESDNSPGTMVGFFIFFFPMGLFPIDPIFYPKTSRFKTSFASNPPEDLLVETASRSLMESRKWTQTPWTDAMEG